ncbi:hypothetical protein LTR62_005613 [Meristemomyces frigidus]|uniref:AHC1-like C2H2 zinc-finger domain-containing protein n=1 Tax=Meristemomyces frigidus TaxID=1508187 RepID=A0AAN7TPE4_9PEZI|nr:hypothetical protein LTR62_005613 [Meristemomyces frigidus]
MQTIRPSSDGLRMSPALDMSLLSNFKAKRKLTDSAELQRVEMAKRHCGKVENFRQSPPLSIRLPVNCEQEQSGVTSTAVQSQPSQTLQTTTSHADISSLMPTIKAESPALIPSEHSRSSAAIPAVTNTTMSEDVAMRDAPEATSVPSKLTPLQQLIENEFNMQILMKHNEARLIEQEIAKCQVALEQLRRVQLRPYPGVNELSLDVSDGKGSSIAPPSGHTRPLHAAPHGVTDGPYSRHYRRWLLQDTEFESVPLHAITAGNATQADSRATRNANSARASIQKSLLAPELEIPKCLPNYPTTSRKNKLAVHKRSSDGVLLKLVCNYCHRSDFANVQGFINHCRIQHHVDYKSHDHAAGDCGQPLDEHEYASVPPELLNAPAAKPKATPSRAVTSTATPAKIAKRVHPMNVPGAAALNHDTATSSKLKNLVPVILRPTHAVKTPTSSAQTPFKASTQAPRLSAQFAKYGLSGNLEAAIASAKEKVDLGAEAQLSPDITYSSSPSSPCTGPGKSVFGVPRPGSLAPPNGVRPPSRKGYWQPAQHNRPSPLVSVAGMGMTPQGRRMSRPELPESPDDRSMNLSPHTIDGNPGLVSDHEDDDQGSASEDEVPRQTTIAHSLTTGGRTCADSMDDNMDIDVSVDDTMDEHGVIIRRNSLLSGESHGLRMADGSARK